MTTWKATVKNTKTGEFTTRIGTDCPVEKVAFNALKAAEEQTPLKDLPDSWEITVELQKILVLGEYSGYRLQRLGSLSWQIARLSGERWNVVIECPTLEQVESAINPASSAYELVRRYKIRRMIR